MKQSIAINPVKEQVMTMREVASFLRLHYDTVRKMVINNELPYVVINGKKRIIKRHLDNWLEMRLVEAVK